VENSIHPELDTCSLVQGGPLYQLMVRMRLVIGESYIRMAIVFVALTWLPLLILSVWRGSATGADVQIPFLRDYAVHARFLISLPILTLAEGLCRDITTGPLSFSSNSRLVDYGTSLTKSPLSNSSSAHFRFAPESVFFVVFFDSASTTMARL
jgi:hypothetical protein